MAITSSGLGLTRRQLQAQPRHLQQDRGGTTLRRWSLSRASPVKFVAGDQDNESDENVIESVTLTYDFFELVQKRLCGGLRTRVHVLYERLGLLEEIDQLLEHRAA